MRRQGRAIAALVGAFVLIAATTGVAFAVPSWCEPRRGIARAIAGEVFGKIMGNVLGGRVLGQAGESSWSVFGPAPTPSSIMRECIAPRLGNPPEPEDPGSDEILSAPEPPDFSPWIVGDPHLVTRDGVRYAFQGAGDYLLLASDGLEIQGRFTRRTPGSSASQPSALALQVGDLQIVLGDEADLVMRTGRARINGMPVMFDSGSWYDLPNGGYVHRVGRLWRVELPGVLSISMEADGSPMEFRFDGSIPGATLGMLGSADGDPNNDLTLADGTPIDPRDTDVLYGAFLDDWLREGSASLFESAFDPAQQGDIRPAEVTTLADFSPEERDTAAQRCLDAGVPADGALLECAFDMLMLDDEELLADHFESGLGMSETLSPELVYAPPGTMAVALSPGDRVAPGVPAEGAGELMAQGEVDRFSIGLDAAVTAYLEVATPCSATQPARIALGGGSAPTTERALVCGASIRVPSDVTWLAVYAADGQPQGYAFDFVAEAVEDIGVIPYDTAISGNLSAYGPLTGEIEAQPGSAVSVQPDLDMPCTRAWSITDAAGTPVASAPQCVRLHEVALTGTPPWRLQLESGPKGAAWGFELSQAPDPMAGMAVAPPQAIAVDVPSNGDPVTTTLEMDGTVRLYFEAVDGASGRWSLLDPDGTEVRDWQAGLDVFVTDIRAGTWTLRFAAAPGEMGVGRVLVHRVPDDTTIEAAVGDTVQLAVTAPGQLASVRLALVSGQRVYVDRDSVLSGRLRMLAPDGSTAATTFLSQEDLLYEATEDGIHELVLDAEGAKTGNFDITLREVADDVQVDIAVGTTQTLAITTLGQTATATLDLSAGQTVTLTVSDRTGPVRLDLLDPEGATALYFLGSSPNTYTATVAGPHAIVLAGTGERVGSAAITVE